MTEKILLLKHHVREALPFWLEFPHSSLEELIITQIIPYLEQYRLDNQEVYPFLKDEDAKKRLIIGLTGALTAYINGDFIEIEDVSITGKSNTDFICNFCRNKVGDSCRFTDEP